MGFSLGDPEYCQECFACRHDRHVIFQDDERIANGIDDALGQLPVSVALLASGTFLTDILNRKQDEPVMIAGPKYLSGVDQHGSPTNRRKIVLDLEPLHGCAMGDDALKESAQRGNIPLPISEVVNETALGLFRACAEGLIKRAIGGGNNQVSVENDEGAGDGLNNVACSNVGYGHFSSLIRDCVATFSYAASRLCTETPSWSSV